MANIPNFLDVNRKKIEFFSASNVIRTKGNIVAGPGPVLPDPSPTPTPTVTPTPTPTPYQNVITGTGTAELVSVVISPGFENSQIFFNNSVDNFEVYGLSILFNGQPSSSVTYGTTKESTYFSYSPSPGSPRYLCRFTNGSLISLP
jgi:hypothetical protein